MSQFDNYDEDQMEETETRNPLRARMKQLEKENAILKQLLAEKELEGKLKTELLKKKYALEKKRK